MSNPLGIQKLTPLVTRITSQPFGPGSQSIYNSYLIGAGNNRILIDSGSGHPTSLIQLKSFLSENSLQISNFIVTSSFETKNIGFSAQKVQNGNILKVEKATLRAVATPGYSNDHMSYWMPEEEVLFSGCSLISRPESKLSQSAYISSNLDQFKKSLKIQQSLFPKLLMPLHGEVQVGMDQIDNLQSRIEETLSRIKAIITGARVTTNEIIRHFTRDKTNSLDLQVLQGNIRSFLLYLIERGDIEIANAVHSKPLNLDTNIKGPGGLTMEQIYDQIQASRKKDYRPNQQAIDTRLHPLHSKLSISDQTSWKIKSRS